MQKRTRPQSCQPKPSKYFNTDKTKTDPYFKEAKINSCHHIKIINGQPRAIIFPITNHKNRPMNDFKHKLVKSKTMKSIYQSSYEPKPVMYAGMGKKPLVHYDPCSYRSRIAIQDYTTEIRNKTHFDIGNTKLVNKKQYVSSAHDSFRVPRVRPISNIGIMSDISRRIHEKLVSIV